MAWLRLTVLLSWYLAGGGVALVLHAIGQKGLRDRFVQWGFRVFLRIARIKVHYHGRLAKERPLMLVSNHLSYMDIPILASYAPVGFTPKSEIASWPVIGYMSRILDCVFVDRRVAKTAENKKALEDKLASGRAICLFAEGTTSDGKRVLPFRSSYFGIDEVAGKPLWIQPASIHYVRLRGMPLDSAQMPKIAWYGDMYLLPHILEFLALGPTEVKLSFFEPVRVKDFANRKELAQYCHEAVVNEIEKKPAVINQ